MVRQIIQVKNKFLEFYQRHSALVSIAVFISGFILDALTLRRIDDIINLIQQAVFLVVLGSLLVLEIKVKAGFFIPQGRWAKFWQYHDLVVHFLFGKLLSAYTIFYYTSASAITSFIFILLLAGLMLANEAPRVRKIGLPVRVVLYNICVLSYFAFFWPIVLRHIGWVPFLLGFSSSMLVMILIWTLNFKAQEAKVLLNKQVYLPAIAIHLAFLLAYTSSLIPPVPVAVKKIGVYYEVEKDDGKYFGKHLRPVWRILDKGSQTFYARPDDKIVILLSIFSPTHFEDKVFLKWYFDDPVQGWVLEDTIPLNILGGRKEGFRGFGSKQYYSFGSWRVLVETSDGREVGRINLEIIKDKSQNEREFKIDSF